MELNREPDFAGWGTRHGVKCSDGRTISPEAFAHNNNKQVPVMWQHNHTDVSGVLGHALLEHREEGVYVYGFFNQNETAQIASEMLRHGDINALSIFANRLKERDNLVLHGDIKEVSLVISGANPEAYIEYVSMSHGEDGDGEAIIYPGTEMDDSYLEHNKNEESSDEEISHEDTEEEDMPTTNVDESTVGDILNELTEDQLTVVEYLVGKAIQDTVNEMSDDEVEHDDVDNSDDLQHNDLSKGTEMTRNVFDKTDTNNDSPVLSHSQIDNIFMDAKSYGSLKDSVLAHAGEYGITDIDYLFPDAKTLTSSPEFVKRRTEWVNGVLNDTKKSPFSRVKTILADITAEEARARGYVKNTLKKEEVIQLLKRTTGPTTIYKKQKLDRDDVVDITSFEVVAWLKAEMRLMLDEEIARAILLGDGRSGHLDDHIKDPKGSTSGDGIRSILHDDDMYATSVEVSANLTAGALVEAVLRSRSSYRGTGTPKFYTTDDVITDMMLEKDKVGRRLYETEAQLASALRVSQIVPVDVMKEYPAVLGIMVNLQDYTLGADKGGQISMFDDFDIDYNQQKYLMEARLSGGLTKPKAAVVFSRTLDTQVTPVMPSFDSGSNTITIPNVIGVEYYIDEVLVSDPQVIDENTEVVAVPATGYFFPQNITTSWTFTYQA